MLRRSKAATITFAAIDADNRPARKSGAGFAASDVQLSKDGAAYANATNAPTEIGSTGRYKLDLTAAELDCGWLHVKVVKSGVDDTDLLIETTGHSAGSVVSDAGNTSGTFKTDRGESVNDHWKDALVLFTSGALEGQVKKISAYNGTSKFITVATAFTAAPSTGDRFVLVNI